MAWVTCIETARPEHSKACRAPVPARGTSDFTGAIGRRHENSSGKTQADFRDDKQIRSALDHSRVDEASVNASARIPACGFYCVVDTLTITSMLPGVDDNCRLQ
jgi:hypothetical protein